MIIESQKLSGAKTFMDEAALHLIAMHHSIKRISKYQPGVLLLLFEEF